MASIRQRSGVWQAQVRRFGFPSEVKTFTSKAEAQAWARAVEAAMDQGVHQSTQSARNVLLSELLRRYGDEVSPTKRSKERELQTIQFMQRHKIAAYCMDKLTPEVVALYRDERLQTVAPATIIRELIILSSIIRSWGTSTPPPEVPPRARGEFSGGVLSYRGTRL